MSFSIPASYIVYILKIIIFSLVHSCSDFHKDLQQYYPFFLQISLLFSDAFRGVKREQNGQVGSKIFLHDFATPKNLF